ERAIAMRRVNPAFIPRNHRVEQAIESAVENGDFSLFEALLSVLSKPYEDQPGFVAYLEPPHRKRSKRLSRSAEGRKHPFVGL
ncbi:hypothetical protein AB9F41_36475, partial [Rhizobium leguminosarum]